MEIVPRIFYNIADTHVYKQHHRLITTGWRSPGTLNVFLAAFAVLYWCLIHCGLVTSWWHRSGSTLALVMAWTAPSHYLNQCWNIVNWTLGNKLQWNFNRNSNIFIQQNAFENVVCKMVSILSWPRLNVLRRFHCTNKLRCPMLQHYSIWCLTLFRIYCFERNEIYIFVDIFTLPDLKWKFSWYKTYPWLHVGIMVGCFIL